MLRGWKTPKSLTKFSRESEESTVEHIARYTLEIGEIATNEYLKMRFFPSSLTKNALHSFRTFEQIPFCHGCNWRVCSISNSFVER